MICRLLMSCFSYSTKHSFILHLVLVMSDLCSSRLPARLLCPWDFPSKNTEWVAMPSSRGFSPPRDRARLQCRPGLQFTQW